MVDNYSATLLAISAFILANAPAGAERELASIRYDLEHPEAGRGRDYFHLEFRRGGDTCLLYVNILSNARGFDDAEGNRWTEYTLEAAVSWPSYGSSDVATCQRRLALMTEVNRFAVDLQKAFPDPFFHLAQTKAAREEHAKSLAMVAGKRRVENLIRANSKGLRVGQERRVEAEGEDFLQVGRVTVESPEGRKYTTEVTATRAFYFTRTA